MELFKAEDYKYKTKELDIMAFDEYFQLFINGFGLSFDDKLKSVEMKLINKVLYDPRLDYHKVIEDYFIDCLEKSVNGTNFLDELKCSEFIVTLSNPYLSYRYLKFGKFRRIAHDISVGYKVFCKYFDTTMQDLDLTVDLVKIDARKKSLFEASLLNGYFNYKYAVEEYFSDYIIALFKQGKLSNADIEHYLSCIKYINEKHRTNTHLARLREFLTAKKSSNRLQLLPCVNN